MVTGARFADAGNSVVCANIDAANVERLRQGEVPNHELGLDVIVRWNFEKTLVTRSFIGDPRMGNPSTRHNVLRLHS